VRRPAVAAVLAVDPKQTGQVLPALTEVLRDGDDRARWQAAQLLSTLGAEARPALPALLGALRDGDTNVRLVVTEALLRADRRQARAALPGLLALLQNPKEAHRERAAAPGGRIGSGARGGGPGALGAAPAAKSPDA